jgi:hypothetical protein
VLEAVFILLEVPSPSGRIFIGSHSLPPSLVRRIGPSYLHHDLNPPHDTRHECREVGEGDDTVTIEDMSDEEDGEMLQERFQLRPRFSRPRLPHIPLVEDPPTSLEASLPTPPRRPHNVTRKRVAKKLKVTETTSEEVRSSSRVVEYLTEVFCMLTNDF